MERVELEGLTTERLRQMVRETGRLSGVRVVALKKHECIDLLAGDTAEVMPEHPGNGHNGHDKSPGAMIDKVLKEFLAQQTPAPVLDPEQIRALVKQEVENLAPRRHVIEIHQQDKPSVELSGLEHKSTPVILAALGARDMSGNTLPLMLTGPAGSGKTTAAIRASMALGLEYELISVSLSTSKSDVFGFVDAEGNFHASPLYRCAKQGQTLIIDEFDACHAGIGTLFNSSIANRVTTFPNGETLRFHPDFRVVACANTFGTGADERYVGRNQLDAATLDRFVVFRIDYDEALETLLCGRSCEHTYDSINAGQEINADQWLERVQSAREAINTLRLQHVISPRASIYGCAMIAAGFSRDWLDSALLFKGLPADQRDKLTNAWQMRMD